MLRRHPIACTLAALLLLTAIAVGTFIATFDLSHYREQLQARLSAALARPVHLGDASFSLRHGPAFYFADLRIEENGGEANSLRADHLLLKLELLPLLKREMVFSEILLEAPRLTLILHPPARPGEKGSAPSGKRAFDDTLIRSLRIRNGTLHLLDRRDPDNAYALALEHLEAKISDASLGGEIGLNLSGILAQEGSTSPFSLEGKLRADRAKPTWRDLEVDLDLLLGQFVPEPLLRHLGGSLPLRTEGPLSLELKMQGSAAGGIHLDGEADGSDLRVHFPALSHEPVVFQRYRVQTIWTDRGSRQQFDGLSLQADNLALAGNLVLEQREDRPWIEGELTSGRIPLLQLSRFLPDRIPAISWLREHIEGGSLEIASARFSGFPAHWAQPDASFPLKEAKIGVHDGVLRLQRGAPLLGIDFSFLLEQERLEIRQGKGLFLGAPLQFSGAMLHPFSHAREVSLDASATLPLQSLLPVLPLSLPEKFKAEGPLPVELRIGGKPGGLLLDLRADLQKTTMRWGEQVAKPADEPGSLFLTGAFTPGRFELNHGLLQVRPFELRSRAEIDLRGEKAFHIALDLAPLPLEKALPYLPSLDRFALRGSVSGNFEVAGSGGKISQRSGTLYLRNLGMHLGGAVADIGEANGQLRLEEDGIQIEGLSARLGISPVRVEGSVRNFSDPRVDLHVRAKTIRARELIFTSEKAVLRDVDGRLSIDSTGILFSPVKLHLTGGTSVSVRGSMKNFRAPQVTLEIEADKADIDEVIDLWNGEAKAPAHEQPAPTTARGGNVSVLIDARVREGILGPLHFQNAQGRIGFADGRLTIFPLRFQAGIGRATGQVELEPQAGGPSLLKISGHLENFDAEALHHELFKLRGLVTGTLAGDFYLEGEPGRNFLASSMGGASLQISDGVLRKFPFLSKVFSLLNVSQLLAFKLPDMAQEGMPFNRLSGNFTLRKGILSTEDLFVDSNAMNLSLVGNADLPRHQLDFVLGLKPLRTVDKIVTKIPIAGWLLTGNEKALITAHFEITGKSEDPDVTPIPITSVSDKVLGIFKRVLGLPGKVVGDMSRLVQGDKEGGTEKGR